MSEVVAVWVPQENHCWWAKPLLIYADGSVTYEDDSRKLSPEQIAKNCEERKIRPRPSRRKKQI